MNQSETLYIGTNFAGHDSAIFAAFPETKEVFAIATERLTRFKHDKLYCLPAISKMLEYRKIDPHKIKAVYLANTFSSRETEHAHPKRYEMLLAERRHYRARFENDLAQSKKHFTSLSTVNKIRNYLSSFDGNFLLFQKILDESIGKISKRETLLGDQMESYVSAIFPNAEIHSTYYNHQYCHAVCSYFTSPFKKALLISFDGWGDGLFSRVYIADNGKITQIAESICHKLNVGLNDTFEGLASPAGFYAYITYLLGFKPLSEEGKVEALAAYGTPNKAIYQTLIGLVSIDKKTKSLVVDHKRAEIDLAYTRMKGLIEQCSREDAAAAVQQFLDTIAVEYVGFLTKETGIKEICLSGGAAANVIMNLQIFEKITPSIHITPAMADDGTAQGAVAIELMKRGWHFPKISWLKGEVMPYYGTSYSKDDVLAAAGIFGNQLTIEDLGSDWPEKTARLLADKKVGAIFHGRMEWGPRALGNRSIIADPRHPEFRDRINQTIKRRPSFQPFCPSILEEEKDRLFEDAYPNRHMTIAFRMKKEFWSQIPSAIHVDGTARAQFVSEKDNPNYYRLLKKVKELTGFGVIINTSFNKHGRTIVETPRDAIVDFLDTDMDYVVIEGIKITRNNGTN